MFQKIYLEVMEWFKIKHIVIGSTEDLRKDYHRTLHKKAS
jgi:hypothetical protein